MTATMQESAAPPQVKQALAAIAVSGIVDMANGHAFVRTSGYQRSPADVSVSAGQIRQYGLRKGDKIEGAARSERAQGPSMGQGAASSISWSGSTPSTGCRPNSPRIVRISTT